MPEAPEVQSVLSSLQEKIEGSAISKIEIRWPKIIDQASLDFMLLEGQHFQGFERHGKWLIFHMDRHDLLVHLRMEGNLFVRRKLPESEKIVKHIHVIFYLEDGRMICYRDTRKFGRMLVVDQARDFLHSRKLGLDVLDPLWDGNRLYRLLQKRRIPIKQALLDQQVVAGIGNIYANEILFAAKIHPALPSNQLSPDQAALLVEKMQQIIARAMELKGCTIRTFSFDGDHPGSFQHLLQVHQKKHCPVCHSEIINLKISQRSSYLCPNCQKLLESPERLDQEKAQ